MKPTPVICVAMIVLGSFFFAPGFVNASYCNSFQSNSGKPYFYRNKISSSGKNNSWQACAARMNSACGSHGGVADSCYEDWWCAYYCQCWAKDGGWSGWSTCSSSCTHTRSCTNPSPSCGGSNCSGPSSESCTGGSCCATAWSDTNVYQCNAGGVRERKQTRASCNNPSTRWVSAACPVGQVCSGAGVCGMPPPYVKVMKIKCSGVVVDIAGFSATAPIASTESSKMKMRKGGTTYSISLVNPVTDPTNSSCERTRIAGTVYAMRKCVSNCA